MALDVRDTRTLVDAADATTGWSTPVNAEALTVFTTNPTPVEATGCIGMAVSEEVADLVHTLAAAADLSDTLVYAWVLVNGSMSDFTTGGIGIILLDATPDETAFHMAGSDVAGFRHSEGPVGWQCVLMDTVTREGVGAVPFTDVAGNEPSLDRANITAVGTYFDVASKALGGAENCFTDIIRYGVNGLVLVGGVPSDPGTFDELATLDRSGVADTAYGICRELGEGLFGLQGPLTFGNADSATDDDPHHFFDTDVVVAFEDRNIETNRYYLNNAANPTDEGTLQFGLISGTDGGSNGCTFVVPTGVGASMDWSDADFDFLAFYDTVFNGFDGAILFCDDATNGIAHDVFACSFIACGRIEPGRVDFKNCSIVNSAATSAMLIDDSDNTLMSGFTFQSDGTGHAIEITHTGAGPHTLTLKGHSYTGYASIDGSTGNEVILYNPGTSTANITITVSESGDTPTVMLAGGVTGVVTVVNNKTITFTGMKDNTEVRVYNSASGVEIAGIEDVTAGSPGDRSFAWTAAAGLDVDYVIHNWQPNVPVYESIRVNDYTVPNDDTSIGIQQRLDRNAQSG